METIRGAAAQLGTTERALRYREALGLLPRHRSRGGHRQYSAEDLAAAKLGLHLEALYDVSPAQLAFALRAIGSEAIAADLRRLAQLIEPATSALDFDQEKAARLLESDYASAHRPKPKATPSPVRRRSTPESRR